MDTQRPIASPPVVGGAGSNGSMPMNTKPELPPVTNGAGGVNDLPTERPLVLPPVIG